MLDKNRCGRNVPTSLVPTDCTHSHIYRQMCSFNPMDERKNAEILNSVLNLWHFQMIWQAVDWQIAIGCGYLFLRDDKTTRILF